MDDLLYGAVDTTSVDFKFQEKYSLQGIRAFLLALNLQLVQVVLPSGLCGLLWDQRDLNPHLHTENAF